MAALPPPMTATFSPSVTFFPKVTSRSKETQSMTPGASSPATCILVTGVRSRGQEDGVIPLLAECSERIDAAVRPYFHADLFDRFYFRIQHILGQPVARNADPHHPSRFRQRLENGHRMPSLLGQIIGRRQPCRTGTDNGNAFAGRRGLRLPVSGRLPPHGRR